MQHDHMIETLTANIVLEGPLGHLWMILQIKRFYGSRWNYLWYVPALAVVVTIFISPLLVCLFFIRQLFSSGDLILGFLYSGLFIPFAAFFLLLVCTAAILGVGARAVHLENELAERVGLVSALTNAVPTSKEGSQRKATGSEP